jgi:hypothetical protein
MAFRRLAAHALIGFSFGFSWKDISREALLSEDGSCMLFRKLMQAKSSFFVLQALDLATTLIAFHFGAFEVNPLVSRLTTLLGPTGGVLASKVVAVLIALRLRNLLWVANLFYLGVVCWNTLIVLILSHSVPHLAHSWM